MSGTKIIIDDESLGTVLFAGLLGFVISTGLAVAALAFVWVVLVVTPARRSGALSEDTSWWEFGEIWDNIGVSAKTLATVCLLGLIISMISSMSNVDPGILGIFSAVFGLLILVSCLVCCARCCCDPSERDQRIHREIMRHRRSGHYYYYDSRQGLPVDHPPHPQQPPPPWMIVPPPTVPTVPEDRSSPQGSKSAPPQFSAHAAAARRLEAEPWTFFAPKASPSSSSSRRRT